MTDEIGLARRLMTGDATAFDEFVETFRTRIFQYSYLMCGQREDAEEVSQETLMKVFEHFDQLREPERIRPWVFRIARNVCSMKRRRSVFAPTAELSLDEFRPNWKGDGEDRRLEIADWSSLPDEQAISGEMSRILRQAIEDLPDIYRTVILLRDVEELSTDESAEILGVTTDVVKTRLHRARLAVRQKVDEALRK